MGPIKEEMMRRWNQIVDGIWWIQCVGERWMEPRRGRETTK